MNLASLRRFLPLLAGATIAALLAGCSTSSPVPPNWYDSAYYKDGSLVNPAISGTAPVANPGN